MDVGVLAQVDARKMKSEDLHRPPQRSQSSARYHGRTVGEERSIEDVEIVAQLGGARIGLGVCDLVARQHVVSQSARGGDEACINSHDRLPIGLRCAARGLVGRATHQLLQLRGHADTGAIERQLAAEQMQFIEIEIEHPLTLHVDGLTQHVRVHERIAIAITTDPASHTNERWELHIAPGWIDGRETIFESRVQAWQLPEERVIVVRKSVGDFVDNRRLPASQQAGLPEDQDRARERIVGRGGFRRRERRAIAACEQLGHLHFAIKDALATHLGRMRGEHRAHQDGVEQRLQGRTRHLCQLERRQRALNGSG
jgi:hypothetical protein